MKKLDRLVKKSRNLTPVMRSIEDRVMVPLRLGSWSRSGLHEKSGELKRSIQTFHGKKSAGVSVHTVPGHDLIIPKAITQTRGAKKHAFRRYSRSKIRSHTRSGRRISAYTRSNQGAPWGTIKARPFIPVKLRRADRVKIIKILEEHLDV